MPIPKFSRCIPAALVFIASNALFTGHAAAEQAQAASPDLAAVAVHARSAKHQGLTWPQIKSPVLAYVEVRNSSNTTVSGTITASCTLYHGSSDKGTKLGSGTGTTTKSIAPQQTRRIKVTLPTPTVAADHFVQCTVDSDANNSATTKFRADLAGSNGHKIELLGFAKTWSGTSHRTVTFKAHQPGGGDYPPDVTGGNAKLGWQAECTIIPMPWVKVREVGNMTHLPFGSMPGRENEVSASAWLFPVNLSGKPKARDMSPALPMACEITVGAFVTMPTAAGHTDLRPVSTMWSGSQLIQLPNPESTKPLKGDHVAIGAIETATEEKIRGWACDTDTPTASIDVEVSFGKSRAHKTKVRAELTSSSTINGKCKGGTHHAFSLVPTKAALDYLRGLSASDRSVYAKGINSNELGKDVDLGSPKALAVSSGATDLVAVAVHPRDGQNLGLTHPEVDGSVWAYVEVKNQSANKLDKKIEVSCSLFLGKNDKGTKLGSGTAVASSTLGASATQAIRVTLPKVTKSAHHFVSCAIDSDGQYSEANETNNVTTAEFEASLRQSNAYEVELVDFESAWGKSSWGHRILEFAAHQPGGRDQPTKSFTSQHKLGWQADCKVMPLPGATVAKNGNMTHRPFGGLPGREKSQSTSAWLHPIAASGNPKLESLGKKLPMICTITTGIFMEMPTKPGQTDLRPIKVLWKGSQQITLDNPKK